MNAGASALPNIFTDNLPAAHAWNSVDVTSAAQTRHGGNNHDDEELVTNPTGTNNKVNSDNVSQE